MDKQERENGRGQNTRRGGSDPTVPQNRGPGPFGLRGSLPPRAAEIAARVLAACMRRVHEFVRHEV